RAAIDRALDGGMNFGAHKQMEGKLAALVSARIPSIELVRFTNSGTEANLMALATACAVTGRKQVLVFKGGYHGGVFYFAGNGSAINAPYDFVMANYNDIDGTLAAIEAHAKTLAAIILEPMMGNGGCIPATREFLAALRQAATRHGIILIFDEVMTSRLSPGGLQGVHGIAPDLTTLGKYIGGGMSVGAFGGRRDIMGRFDPRRPDAFPHAGTFNNNILTMSAGVAALSQVYTADAARELNARGDRLRERLNQVARKAGARLQFTGIGSMLQTHFHDKPIRSPDDAAKGSQELRELFFFDLLAHGVWSARRGMINLSLPVTEADCDALVAAVAEFVDSRRSLIKG
ncbi:MAG: aminotransferase class III-fold pyridoxal phosphate-dependent enzyme, partial [Proteobacteria bacterium]|nr:aminotransferase class III-fold pyridoxal phosphate-dependent enzyme [Pseudomonadota bacterium]